ncbi:MAG: right-handed parallel beta-helix repeat-containing protein [Candidatus Brocadiia bacterium]
MRRCLTLGALVFICLSAMLSSCAPPEKELKGRIQGDLIIEPGRYVFKGLVVIEPMGSLSIPNGAELRFAEGSKLVVEGKFIARAQAVKKVTIKAEGCDGIFVGPGYSGLSNIVTEARLRLENCEFSGKFNGPVVTGRSSSVEILKGTFATKDGGIITTEGCPVIFDGNKFVGRDIPAGSISIKGADTVLFAHNSFRNCKIAARGIYIDGRDSLSFNKNAFNFTSASDNGDIIVCRQFFAIDVIENLVAGFNSEAGTRSLFFFSSSNMASVMRNRFENNSAVGQGTTLLKVRAISANFLGNRFTDNSNVDLLALAGNDLTFNTNWIKRNLNSEHMLSFYGRKGSQPANLSFFSSVLTGNSSAAFINCVALNQAYIHDNIIEGTGEAPKTGCFIQSNGTQHVAFDSNKVRNIKSPEFARVISLPSLESYDWVDPGNIMPAHSAVSFSMSQDEFESCSVALMTDGDSMAAKPLMWEMMSNVFKKCAKVEMMKGLGGHVSGDWRFNRFERTDSVRFFASGKGGMTIVERNTFSGTPLLIVDSETKNPGVDFRIYSNVFESWGKGLTIRKIGEVDIFDNMYDSAVMWE